MKNSQENILQRQNAMLRYINEKKRTSVGELSEVFCVSKVTVRHDIDALEQQHLIRRSFGGADALEDSSGTESGPSSVFLTGSPQTSLPGNSSFTSTLAAPVNPVSLSPGIYMENTFFSRGTSSGAPDFFEQERRNIAKEAAALIEDNDIVFISNSETASYTIEYISSAHVTVVTNNLHILNRKRSKSIRVILTGGETDDSNSELTGFFTLDSLVKVVANKCILGVDGVNSENGISNESLSDSYIDHKMLEQTNGSIIVVATAQKVGLKYNYPVCGIGEITTLVTSANAGIQELNAIRKAGTNVITAAG